MALGIRDYYLFISYLDFKVCAEQGLSDVCVCIISMSRAKVSSCACQALPPTSLLFPPRVLLGPHGRMGTYQEVLFCKVF